MIISKSAGRIQDPGLRDLFIKIFLKGDLKGDINIAAAKYRFRGIWGASIYT